MAANSDKQENRQRREVSYFGPIYIAAYPTKQDPGRTEGVVPSPRTSDKSTSTEALDISKYKIPTETDKKSREKSESPRRSPKRFLKQVKLGIGERFNRHNNHHHDGHEKVSEKTTEKKLMKPSSHEPRLPLPVLHTLDSYQRNNIQQKTHDLPSKNTVKYAEEDIPVVNNLDRTVSQNTDPDDETYETLVETSFKISSTEDNYLKNKVDNQQTDYTGRSCAETEEDESKTDVHNDKTSECKLENTTDTDNQQSKERMFRHREMIAKLKRKFFESPPKTIDKLHTNKKDEASLKQHGTTEKLKQDHNKEVKSKQIDQLPKDSLVFENKKSKIKMHFATESRASRLRNSGKSIQGRHRRLSLDGKLSGTEVLDDQDSNLLPRTAWQSAGYVAVVAIDFGTTQSGYAYSFIHDPGIIYTMRRHDGGDPGVFNQKIPTTILLTPDGDFHSFGFAAIDFYHDLDPKDSPKWMFFDRFKMLLFHEKTLAKNCMLKSVSGKEVSAMKIFALSLGYFKDLVLQELTDQSDRRITCDVIRWVITVPAIWRASAKQFMREAAYQAGLVHPSRPDQLLIALEPEAASIYCRKLRLLQVLESPPRDSLPDQSRASTLSLPDLGNAESSHISNDLSVGTRYLVVDCGGGTVDITVHEILPHGRLKELHRASGGAHGSTGVDAEFERLLQSIFGEDIITHFKRKRPSGWVELMSMFESRKRVAGPYRTSHISVSLPFSFIDFYKKSRGHSVDSAVKKYGDPDLTWTSNGMLKLTPRAMRRLFLPTIDGMKQAIGAVLNSPNTRDLSYLFLVGGFAESSMVQHEIRKDFGGLLKIIIPPGVGMTIVKGAVYFGLDPNVVRERISCQTYGVGVLHRFDPLIHSEDKRITKDGIAWCTDIFDAFVRVNQSVALGDRIIRRYTPVRRNQTVTTIHIYSTERDDVLFISDDDVTCCGTLSLSLDDADELPGSRREIRAEMTFGDTEIKVCATDVASGRCVEANIDFINV